MNIFTVHLRGDIDVDCDSSDPRFTEASPTSIFVAISREQEQFSFYSVDFGMFRFTSFAFENVGLVSCIQSSVGSSFSRKLALIITRPFFCPSK